jgi:hypothetical protein
MAGTERKHELFEQILRLRRAERAAPRLRDVVVVRVALEEQLGETVSQRLAAALLRVSHTALRRWIDSGDIPLVYTADGRDQVPLRAVLDLRESMDRERAAGRRTKHLLEPLMMDARARADALDPLRLLPLGAAADDPHERASRRSLAYHRAVADHLSRPMVDDALHTIWGWREQGRIDPRYGERWERILDRPIAEVREIIGEDSPDGRDLRQSSPFAGFLSEPERRKILSSVR